MPSALFYFFAILMVILAVAVFINRNPVASAMCLVGSFVCLAALFIGLDAYFIGIIQILVYAGAIMVLFLFIIMLLDLKAEEKRQIRPLTFLGGMAVVIVLVFQLSTVLYSFEPGRVTLDQRPIDTAVALESRASLDEPGSIAAALERGTLPDVHLLGERLFLDYKAHLQIVGVLLLVATVGVVVLSRKRLS